MRKLRPYRYYIMLLGMALLGYISYSYGQDLWRQISSTHQEVVSQSQRFGLDTVSMYGKCLMNATCSNWLTSRMAGTGAASSFTFMGALLALILAVFPLLLRRKGVLYTARFADESEIADISFKNWLKHEQVEFSIPLGFYHRLPDYNEQPLRDKVLAGEALPELSKEVVAIPMGYGDRKEFGHMVTSGMTRSGKTLSLYAQAALWRGSFVALDIKGELHSITSGLRATRGPVYIFTPQGGGHRFNAISEIMKLNNGASTAANLIIRPGSYTRPEFAERASIGLAAIFQASQRLDVNPLEFAKDVVLGGSLRSFIERVATLRDEETAKLANLFLGTAGVPFTGNATGEDLYQSLSKKDIDGYMQLASSDRFLQSAWPMMSMKLMPLLTKEVMWMMSGNDFQVHELVDSPCSVYLIFPEASLPITSPIYDLLVQAMVYGASNYVDQKRTELGQRWFPEKPMFFALDEGKKAPIADLEGFLSTAAGRGITVSMYLQSIAQLDALYGSDGAESILANCNIQNYYKTESLKTAKHIAERCHQVSVESRSVSRVRNRFGRPINESKSSKERSVFSVSEVYLLGGKRREMFLSFVSGKRPMLLKRINYYETGLLPLLEAHPATEIPEMGVVSSALAVPSSSNNQRADEVKEDTDKQPSLSELKPAYQADEEVNEHVAIETDHDLKPFEPNPDKAEREDPHDGLM